ncbi:MAG: DedA family protein [Candidatus Omnitrophica bacterium]|nr:DedA family protein [Candidatus Omnitrophota bacterium]
MIHSANHVVNLINGLGDIGVFIGMFLESSVVPIPSEVVIIGASSVGIPVVSIAIFGSLGATLGAMVGYLLGRCAAMPVILKYGKFVLIKPHHIEKAEKFAKKYGVYSVLIGRVLPVVPFKVFSIAAGITKIPFVPFVVCTLIGVVPRIFLLAMFGLSLAKFTKPTLMVAGGIVLIFLAYKASHAFYKSASRKRIK